MNRFHRTAIDGHPIHTGNRHPFSQLVLEGQLPRPNARRRWFAQPARGGRSALRFIIGQSLLGICGAIALATTAYLTWATATASPVYGCGGEGWFQCEHVLKSQWSRWFSLPVVMLGLPIYGTMMLGLGGLTIFSRPSARLWAWKLIVAASFVAGLSAVWFLALQVFAIGHLCMFCLIVHSCGLAAFVLVAMLRPTSSRWMWGSGGLALAAVGLLAFGQFASDPLPTYRIDEHNVVPADESPSIFSPPDVFESPLVDQRQLLDVDWSQRTRSMSWSLAQVVSRLAPITTTAMRPAGIRSLHLLNQTILPAAATMHVVWQDTTVQSDEIHHDDEPRLASFVDQTTGRTTHLDSRHWPLIGHAHAESVVIEMFDYTCTHCRRTHHALQGARQQLGDRFAVIVLPVPLNIRCNRAISSTNPAQRDACELAEFAVAVWRIDHQKFQEYHEWLFTGQSAPTAAAARTEAERLVGQERLAAELSQPVVKHFIEKHVELYRRAGGGTMPKILFPRTTVVGEIASADELVQIIEKQLGLK